MKINGKPARELGKDSDGCAVLEPYCGECAIDTRGVSWCTCGHTFEERWESGWKLSGAKGEPQFGWVRHVWRPGEGFVYEDGNGS